MKKNLIKILSIAFLLYGSAQAMYTLDQFRQIADSYRKTRSESALNQLLSSYDSLAKNYANLPKLDQALQVRGLDINQLRPVTPTKGGPSKAELDAARRLADKLAKDKAVLAAQLAAQKAATDAARAAAADLEALVAGIKKDRKALADAIKKLEGDLAAKTKDLADITSSLSDAKAALAAAKASEVLADAKAKDLQKEIDKLKLSGGDPAKIKDLEDKLADANKAHADALKDLGKQKDAIEALKAQVKDLEAKLDLAKVMDGTVAGLKADADSLEAQVKHTIGLLASAGKLSLEGALATYKSKLAQSKTDVATAVSKVATADKAIKDKYEKPLNDILTALNALDPELKKIQDKIKDLELDDKKKALESRLAVLVADKVALGATITALDAAILTPADQPKLVAAIALGKKADDLITRIDQLVTDATAAGITVPNLATQKTEITDEVNKVKAKVAVAEALLHVGPPPPPSTTSVEIASIGGKIDTVTFKVGGDAFTNKDDATFATKLATHQAVIPQLADELKAKVTVPTDVTRIGLLFKDIYDAADATNKTLIQNLLRGTINNYAPKTGMVWTKLQQKFDL